MVRGITYTCTLLVVKIISLIKHPDKDVDIEENCEMTPYSATSQKLTGCNVKAALKWLHLICTDLDSVSDD